MHIRVQSMSAKVMPNKNTCRKMINGYNNYHYYHRNLRKSLIIITLQAGTNYLLREYSCKEAKISELKVNRNRHLLLYDILSRCNCNAVSFRPMHRYPSPSWRSQISSTIVSQSKNRYSTNWQYHQTPQAAKLTIQTQKSNSYNKKN